MMLSRFAILPAVGSCLCVLMIGGVEGQQPAERQAKLRAGITAEKEKEVLAAWHAKKKA